jgi:signal-transduction protein with cAMP-binding, CBS, and nucleotidyltransferase domain
MMNTFFVELRPSDSVLTAAKAMHDECIGIVCVCDEHDAPVGVLTDRDITVRVCARELSPETTLLESVMTAAPMTCNVDDSAAEVEGRMQQRGVGRALVVDDAGKLVGIVSLAEIWHHESPFKAESVSRRITQRELRMNPTGARLGATGAPIAPAPPHLPRTAGELLRR